MTSSYNSQEVLFHIIINYLRFLEERVFQKLSCIWPEKVTEEHTCNIIELNWTPCQICLLNYDSEKQPIHVSLSGQVEHFV